MDLTGEGTIAATTVVHRGGTGGPKPPYRVAYVDMDAGCRLFGPVDATAQPGERVRIRVESDLSSENPENEPPYRFEAALSVEAGR